MEGKQIVVTSTRHGYAQKVISGTCGPDVTRDDIIAEFGHEYPFGYREVSCHNGQFQITVHTD